MDNRTPEERFWPKVARLGPEECWPWMAGKLAAGYGSFCVEGRTVKAHRFAYELLVGPIAPGAVLDHVCHNIDGTCPGGVCAHRACVNPAHLEPVTQGVNLIRSRHTLNGAGARQTACIHGHPYTEENTAYEARGVRYCRTCKRASYRRADKKRRGRPRPDKKLLRRG